MAFNGSHSDWTANVRNGSTSSHKREGLEVIDLEDGRVSEPSYHSQDWYEHEHPITLQRKVSTAASLTKAMIKGIHPHRPSSGISLHEQSNFQPQDSVDDICMEDLMKMGKKKQVQQTNVRATMGFWKLIWFDFKNWYRRWRVKNRELILFKKTIKSMESNFGSAIGSLFVFTRWLILLNFFLAFAWLGFVVFPVVIKFNYQKVIGEFAFKNLLDGKGVVGQSWLFYGGYGSIVGGYHVGLAYLFMLIITYFGSMFIILGSIINSSDKKTVSTVEKHYKFSLMLWTSWDHSITSSEAAVNLSKGIASAFKDNLYEAKATQDVKQRTGKETCKVYSLRALAWLITLILIGGGCTAIVYLVLFMSVESPVTDEDTGESQDFLSVYGTTLAFSLINALVPSCIHQLPKIEQYASGRDELNVTLMRVFVLRMANLFALIFTLYDTATRSVQGCAGTVIGQELYKLVIMDSLLHTVFQLTFKLCKHFWTREKSEFNIPTAILVLIYRQALIWAGTLACPVMPLVGLLSILMFFFVNYIVISRTCKPPIKRWNQSRNTSFFTMFLLASLVMLIPPAAVVMGSTDMVNLGQTEEPQNFCGPFGAENPTRAYARFYNSQPQWIHLVLEYLVSETVVLPLFLILFSVMVHQTSKIGNVKRRNLVLQAELQQAIDENLGASSVYDRDEMIPSNDGSDEDQEERQPTGYCMNCQDYPQKKCLKYHNVMLANRFLENAGSLTAENIFSRSGDSIELPSEQSQDTTAENSGIPRKWDKIRTQHIGDVEVKLDRDQKVCNITGSTVMSDEKLAIADYNNSRLKVIDMQRKEICAVLELGSKPWDVTEVCSGHLAVTLMDQQAIVFVQVGHILVRGREIKVRGYCTGIDMFREDKFVVSFMYPGKVEIIDMQGRILRIFSLNRKGGEFFSGPQNVTVCPYTQTIYVSDCIRHMVTRLRADGKVLGVFHDEELHGPVKIVIPKPGVIFICGFESRSIHVLTQDLEKLQILPVNLGVKENPYSLSYCEDTGRLYVTVACKNFIIDYQLS